MKTRKISLKPISIDAHFKYRCPNPECTIEHWLSLNEAKTKNFKVVCCCGTIFSPKRINNIQILYKKKKKTPETASASEVVTEKEYPKIPVELLEKSAKILSIYGFTDNESRELLVQSYAKNPTSEVGSLVKFTLERFGGKHG